MLGGASDGSQGVRGGSVSTASGAAGSFGQHPLKRRAEYTRTEQVEEGLQLQQSPGGPSFYAAHSDFGAGVPKRSRHGPAPRVVEGPIRGTGWVESKEGSLGSQGLGRGQEDGAPVPTNGLHLYRKSPYRVSSIVSQHETFLQSCHCMSFLM